MAHWPLHDPLAAEMKERGEPAVCALEEQSAGDDAAERVGAEDAKRAREVAELRRQEEPASAVGERRRQPPCRGVVTRRADAARERRPVDGRDQRR